MVAAAAGCARRILIMGKGRLNSGAPQNIGVTTMEHLKNVTATIAPVSVSKAAGKEGPLSGLIEAITDALAGLKEPEEPTS